MTPPDATVMTRRCGNLTDDYAVTIICTAPADHDGDHHARDAHFHWPDPPPTVTARCRGCWWRRRPHLRERATHPWSGGAAWLWIYRCPHGHARTTRSVR